MAKEKLALWVALGASAIALLLGGFAVWEASHRAVVLQGQQVGENQLFGGTTGLGSLSLTGDLTVAGASTLTGTTTQTGALALGSTLSVSGLTTLSNLLNTSTSTFRGAMSLPGYGISVSTVTATGTSNFAGITSSGVQASSTTIGNNGSVIDLVKMVTTTIDVSSIAAWGSTSSQISVSGAKAQDFCGVSTPFTSTGDNAIKVTAVAGTDVCTLYFNSVTGTSVDLGSGVFSILDVSNSSN